MPDDIGSIFITQKRPTDLKKQPADRKTPRYLPIPGFNRRVRRLLLKQLSKTTAFKR